MAGWLKMPLGMEEGLCSGDSVLDGDPAPPPQKGGEAPSPILGPCPLWPNGWMHQVATRYGGRPQPDEFVLHGDPTPPQIGGGAPSRFKG